MTDFVEARAALVAVLKPTGTLLGTRLKQLLSDQLSKQTGRRFDQRVWGFTRFIDFLRANGDLVEVEDKVGPGDRKVSLRANAEERVTLVPPELAAKLTPFSHPKIRNDVWQAFANPDPNRKRFFNRESGQVVHFDTSMATAIDRVISDRVERQLTEFIEIPPIPADEQQNWFREFLAAAGNAIPEPNRFSALLDSEYTSALNADFTSLLGQHSESWRRFRAEHVIRRAERWCDEVEVPFSSILLPPTHTSPHRDEDRYTLADRKRRFHILIDSLSEDELDAILLPARVVLGLLSRHPKS